MMDQFPSIVPRWPVDPRIGILKSAASKPQCIEYMYAIYL